MHIVLICTLAFLAMVMQDILSVAMTQANARNKASLSGVLDMVSWGVALFTTFISLDALDGSNLVLKISVIASVSAANYIGSVLGVRVGQKFIKPTVKACPGCCACLPKPGKNPPHAKK